MNVFRTSPNPAAAVGHGSDRFALGPRYGAIDSLRFLAMVGVIAQHCDIMPIGWIGVWLFFVISGFVVTQSVSAHPHQDPWRAVRAFYARRAARILPLYYIFAAVAAITLFLLGSRAGAEHFVPILLLYQNISSIFVDDWLPRFPISHLWTISSEMQFYALFGALFFFVSRRTLTAVMLMIVVSMPLIRFLVAFSFYASPWNERAYRILLDHTLLSQADAFAAGVLLSLCGNSVTKKYATLMVWVGMLATVGFLGFYMGINALSLGRWGLDVIKDILSGDNVGQYREVVLYIPVTLVSVGLVASALTNAFPARWLQLNHPFLQRAGRTSYSGYIWHFAVIAGLRQTGKFIDPTAFSSLPFKSNYVTFLLAVPLTLLVAEISFRWIERPLNWMTWRRKDPSAQKDRTTAAREVEPSGMPFR